MQSNTKYGHTDGFSVSNFVEVLEKYLGGRIFDYIIFNIQKPSPILLKKYSGEGDPVKSDAKTVKNKRFIGANLVSPEFYRQNPADRLKRTLIRHDPDKLAKTIISLL